MGVLPRPSTGVMHGCDHFYPIRVYLEETDAGQMVYHASYLRFAERARTEMIRANGLDLRLFMVANNLVITVHSSDIKYVKQGKLDDELIVRTQVKGVSGASVDIVQHIYRIKNNNLGDIIAELVVRLAIVDVNTGRPQRMPTCLNDMLERLCDKKG